MRWSLCAALSMALIASSVAFVAPAANAAPVAKVGDCLSDADVVKDMVDFSSKVDCATPHRAQVLAVRKLPASLQKMSYSELGKTGSTAYRTWTEEGYRLCTGTTIARTVWGKAGPGIMRALGSSAVQILPSQVGWNLPDERSWNAGDSSLYCIAHNDGSTMTGDLRNLGTSKPSRENRDCYDTDYRETPCDRPHDSELLFVWYATGFPKVADTSTLKASDFAPWDKRCQGAADVLVGAKRSDIYGYAEVDTRASTRNVAWGPYSDTSLIYCSVRRTDRKPLPAGTVVKLGSKALS